MWPRELEAGGVVVVGNMSSPNFSRTWKVMVSVQVLTAGSALVLLPPFSIF